MGWLKTFFIASWNKLLSPLLLNCKFLPKMIAPRGYLKHIWDAWSKRLSKCKWVSRVYNLYAQLLDFFGFPTCSRESHSDLKKCALAFYKISFFRISRTFGFDFYLFQSHPYLFSWVIFNSLTKNLISENFIF